MITYSFEVRHHAANIAETIASEIYGLPRTVYRTTGQVLAWTRWGARRLIRRKYGARLIEIVDIRKKNS